MGKLSKEALIQSLPIVCEQVIMTRQLSDSRLANLGASAIYNSFLDYRCEFETITLRARNCFQNRLWQQGQVDAVERLDLYKKLIDGVVAEIRCLLGNR